MLDSSKDLERDLERGGWKGGRLEGWKGGRFEGWEETSTTLPTCPF
jgi:hypothetical protein